MSASSAIVVYSSARRFEAVDFWLLWFNDDDFGFFLSEMLILARGASADSASLAVGIGVFLCDFFGGDVAVAGSLTNIDESVDVFAVALVLVLILILVDNNFDRFPSSVPFPAASGSLS